MHARKFFIQRRGFVPAVFFCLLWFCQDLSAEEPAREVVFCSYNVKNWLLMQRSFGDPDEPLVSKPEKEKAKVVEFLTEIRPDILGLCEIGSLEDIKEVQTRLRSSGVDLPHLTRCTGGDPTRSLGLLSRYPIMAVYSQTRLYYQMGAISLPMQRGILDATVSITPELQVRFLGVHLKSKRAIPEADETLMRRNEAHLLRLHMDQIYAQEPDAKVVCYGDFNEHRNEPAISEIIGSRAGPGLMFDLHLRDAHGLVWTHFWDDADVYGRLDYIFVSRSLRPLVDMKGSFIYTAADFDKASDHRPIVMTLLPQRKISARKK
ncbi:endonuclease/exonuclease/phosphatase family protein [Prosthecobacter fusiformis]|uniref:Endonuclease/exonuclease/phosphatase family protein n=1 Tax=Prosthecobacter fusiformis TaxID=48464 RepID=A0A4R7RZD3_9BACT|nr:endonuclease/exonuclease/phosphatase family protein [Prosthecobacter fusiformis]TDU70769.1 endonuclease/exonuclease/phosphatase family protein [Prosthecobacter fusiformis]